MSDHPQRRLSAIVSIDVAGYSRLMGRNERGTLEALKAHRAELIDDTIAEHGGRIVKTTGDGMLIEFPSVVSAVESCIAVQHGMGQRNAGADGDNAIRFRIGVHLGDIIVDGDDIFGDGVNVAARLQEIGDPGGITVSAVVHDYLDSNLAEGFADLGERELKNIRRPIRVWQRAGDMQAPGPAPLPLPQNPSIAVLPFDNMSGDPEQDYFSDGITEEIITALSRFDGLFVIARNSSFAYKGRPVDAKTVARELGVHFILSGSVRKAGQRVRITAQLIDGQDGNHLWAERYDGALEDVFDLQEQVTSQVVGSIAPQIAAAELARINRGERVFDAAHELAWQAQEMFRSGLQQRDPSMWERAIALAVEAVAANPKCGVAYLTICETFSMQSLWRWGDDPSAAAEMAEDWAKKFFEQLPASYLAYYCLGQARWRRGEHQEALRFLRQALELNPNDSMVLRTLAVVEASAGDFGAAKAHALLAIRVNPKDPFNHAAYLALSMASFIEGDTANFVDWVSKGIQLSPNAPIRRAMMMVHAAEEGNRDLLETHRAELKRISPGFIDSLFRGENQVFQNPEHMKKLLDGLRRAGFPE